MRTDPDQTRSNGCPGQPFFSRKQRHEISESLRLSAREFQIVQRIFADEKESAIASDIGVSSHTVDTYLRRLYRKLGVFSRVQLVVRVVAEFLTLQNLVANLSDRNPATIDVSGQ